MLPESSHPVAEIMQTEDISSKTLDEDSALIHSSDIEMTVKEGLEDQPLEACEKPSTATSFLLDDECIVTEPSDKHSVNENEQNQRDCAEPLQNKNFSTSQESPQPQIISPALHGVSPESEDIHECTTSLSSESTPLSVTTGSQQKNERGKGRGRRRSRWKLKFHHQALPPEYLDHYEASMAQQEASTAAKSAVMKTESKGKSCGLSSPKSVPALAPRSSPTEKLGKQVPPSPCFIKIESDRPQFNTIASPLANSVDHLHLLPIQALAIGNDSDVLKRLSMDVSNKDDISIISEKPPMHGGRINQCSSKGLLGSLLSNTPGAMEMCGKMSMDAEHKRRSSVIMTSSSSSGCNINNIPSRSPTPAPPTSSSSSGNCSKIVKYQDLPYMGEITLDNMKPRRGRKPKKADICHLIYKNYGTIFPGTPMKGNPGEREDWSRRKLQESSPNVSSPSSINSGINTKVKPEIPVVSSLKCKPFELLKSSGQINHTDVQNRIISSLLEKRLTAASQDAKRYAFGNMDLSSSGCDESENTSIVSSSHDVWSVSDKQTSVSTGINDEPLNLCIKDLNQLKIRLLRKHGNIYEPRTNDVISIKSEPPSPSDVEELDLCDSPVESETKFIHESRPQTSSSTHQQDSEEVCEPFPFPTMDCSSIPPTPILPLDAAGHTGPLPGGYIYWPSAGVFVHPMALQSQLLYYQKMGAIPLVPVTPSDPCQQFLSSQPSQVNLLPHVNHPVSSSTLPSQPSSSKSVHNKEQKSSPNKTQIPKAFSMMMETSTKSAVPSEATFSRMKRLAPLGNPPAVGAPTKRKRSAIFIPPMPTENSTNPTTEVSICKFKFTGGAKPSLQEKKMLSVDSGGNFRYYSGTGDKSMRGYEFFPRESLQQPSGSSGASPSEQFLAASALANGEKMIANTNLTFAHDDQRAAHLKQLTELTETASKASCESVGRLMDSNSQSFEQQTSSLNSGNKKSDLPGKGRTGINSSSNGGGSGGGGSVGSGVSGNSGDRFGPPVNVPDDSNSHSQFRLRRKRKTRKSLAREKLEQTFKEKGFLIQTQQLESAEGATYCKFRQLRKFTRYLFRSWKDYLPGNVREMSVAAGVAGADTSPTCDSGQMDSEVEGELSSSSSPTPSTIQQVTDSSPPQLSNT